MFVRGLTNNTLGYDKELPTILITSLIHNRAWILKDFLKCCDKINYPNDKISYYFLVNNNSDEGLDILKEWCEGKNAMISAYNFELKSDKEHSWDNNLLRHMAVMRNNTLDVAKQLKVDYMINIDSDILFPRDVVRHLVDSDKDIISPVFFAGWGSSKKLPQCWDRGGFELSQSTLDNFKTRRAIFKVGGLGAFTCIHKSVWQNDNVNYSRVYNLPTNVRGEDRDFCMRAVCNGFDLWASTYYDLLHIDNKEMYDDFKKYNILRLKK